MDEADEREIEKLKRDRKRAEKKDNLKEVAQFCNYIGELLAKHGKWEEAIAEHETELGLSEALNDTIGLAVASRKLGECYCGLENYGKALQLQQRHLSLAVACKDALEEQRAWATIGRTYLFMCDTTKSNDELVTVSKKAEDAFRKSLDVCERLKSSTKNSDYMEMKARLYLNLGLVFDGRGDLKQCADFIKQAIKISEQHNLHSDLYRCHFSLSGIYLKGGNPNQASQHLDYALKCAQKLKDKFLESETLASKALVCMQLKKYSQGKHYLKKAHKLGTTTTEEAERIVKLFKSASKLEESSSQLEKTSECDIQKRLKIYERLGDASADAGFFKQALDFYLSMLKCAEELRKPNKDLIPIYVSLAQTYTDNKHFEEAITYYQKEIAARQENEYEQICRTWLNIAECQEQSGQGYEAISKSCLTAFEMAGKSKHRKLQLYVLKSLIEMQKAFKQSSHQEQTEKKIKHIEDKYGISRDDELSEDEQSNRESDEDGEDGNLSISELTESESSGDEEIAGTKENFSGAKCRRNLQIKRNEKGETPLHRACIEGNLKKVKKFIEQGHPVNTRDYCGWTPLHEAANHDFYDVVVILLDNGADINDRGGKECGGVTPLIDAANCGNLEIMDLLITRGANIIAKDDEGNTALDSLKDWKERSGTLDGETMSKFKDIENKLIGRLQGTVFESQPSRSQTRQSVRSRSINSPSVESEMPRLSTLKLSAKKRTATNLRRDLSDSESEPSDIEDSNKRCKTLDRADSNLDIEDSEEFYPNPMLDNLNSKTTSATDAYKSAISRIGSSASRRTSSQNATVNNLSKSQKEALPLVLEDQIVDDDWLIDDMNLRPSKRRKMDIDGVFTTNTARNVTKQGKKSNKILEDSDSNSNEGMSDINVTSQSVNRTSENVNIREKTQVDDIDMLFDVDDLNEENVLSDDLPIMPNTQQTRNKNNRLSTKPRQLRMTNFGVRQNIQSQNLANRELPSSPSHIGNIDIEMTSTQSSVMTNQISSVMRVKVKVKDKLLLIPVSQSNSDRTISWLAKETSQRYYSLCGLQPLLTLSTKDGAFLSPDDPISLVLSTNEEIVGNVDNWDLPPLADRYEQACKTLNSVSYRNTKTILDSCDNTGYLKLCDLALRPTQIQPVFRALQCQNNLKEVNLQGNRIGDNGLEGFLKVCSSIPNLMTLDLSCNMITAGGIKNLADCLSSSDEQGCLQSLSTLNLGHNPLGDTVCLHIATIVSKLPHLTDLSLSACEFTSKLFQQYRVILEDYFTKSKLHNLDMSYNHFGSLGIELLLKSINSGIIQKLDISGNISSTSPSHTLLHIQNFLSKDGCMLQHLDLSDCQLTPEDDDFIIRLPLTGKHLQSLSLNRNPKLNNQSLCKILEIAAKHDSKLESLTLLGCGIKSPIDTDLLDSICDKLSCPMPLKYLKFSCCGLDKMDKDSLRQIWTQHWREDSVIIYTDSTVSLSVRDT